MGQEVVRGLMQADNLQLVGAVDVRCVGMDIGIVLGGEAVGIEVSQDLRASIDKNNPQVMIDFTVPNVAMEHARLALSAGVFPVIGTTGFTMADIDELHQLCERTGLAAVVAPNFAMGAILMMRFAREAVRYFPRVEIIEMHHDAKMDAPSGTALKTAEMLAEEVEQSPGSKGGFIDKLAGVRGGDYHGVRIHSVRLPGLMAHQEVIFGGLGQVLTLRHDSISRESFVPGVLLAVERVTHAKGVIYGLENLL
ncbi:dihydrodipicolinate reductase [Clostridiales bacterium PH28_bin88]|nr:dihydrodipicolinate reductase [Clostridiales bacterium PH28_bin88]